VITTFVTFVVVTVNVDEMPDVIDWGFALIASFGVGVTVTKAVAVTVPPGPVAVAV
jgi:hypothetical protein